MVVYKMIYIPEDLHTDLLLLKINNKKRNIAEVIREMMKKQKKVK